MPLSLWALTQTRTQAGSTRRCLLLSLLAMWGGKAGRQWSGRHKMVPLSSLGSSQKLAMWRVKPGKNWQYALVPSTSFPDSREVKHMEKCLGNSCWKDACWSCIRPFSEGAQVHQDIVGGFRVCKIPAI